MDKKTYQSPEYDQAAGRVEITAERGLGNVIISLDTGEDHIATVPKGVVETKRSVR